MNIDKNEILEHIAIGDADAFLAELSKNMKPNEVIAIYTTFAEVISELHEEDEIEDYDLTPPFMGTPLPINLKVKS